MRWGATWLVALCLIGAVAAPAAAAPSPEQRRKEIQSEVDRLRAEVGEAADQETGLIAELEVSRKALQNLDAQMASLDSVIAAAEDDVSRVNAELQATAATERDADAAVEAAERQLHDAQSLLRDQAVQAFIRFGTAPSIDRVVSQARDVSAAPRFAAYVAAVAERQAGVVERHQRLQESTTLLKAAAADAKVAVVARRQEVTARKAALDAARVQQAVAQVQVASEAANEQRLLAQAQSQKGAYEKRINQLERESNDVAAELRRRQAGQAVAPIRHGVLSPPVAHPVVTSTFGYRVHPIYGDRRLHAGVDFRAATGSAVMAAGDGTVVFAGWKSGYGNTVIIDHGGSLATLYAHNSELAVSVGQKVRRGSRIASAGSTGDSTGPHVHFEVRVNGTPVQPMDYL